MGSDDVESDRPQVMLTCTDETCRARYRVKRGRVLGRSCKKCGSPLVPADFQLKKQPEVSLPALELEPEEEQPAAPERFAGHDRIEVVWADARGELLQARDRRANRVVALRVLPHEMTVDPEAAAAFLERAQRTARLEHPNIVAIHEIGLSTDRELYATRHWIDGERLLQRVERWRRRGAPPPLQRRLMVFLKICDALGYAHAREVTHGALTMESAILGDYGEVIVLDWDRGMEAEDGAAGDLVALGAMLRHIVTLAPPGRGRRHRSTGASRKPVRMSLPMPRELDAVASGMESGRYEGAPAVKRDIEAFLDGQTLRAVRYTPLERFGKWARRHRGFLALAAFLACVVAAGVLVVLRGEAATRDAALRRASAAEKGLPDPRQLPGWRAVTDPSSDAALPVETESEREARERMFDQFFGACRAWEEALAFDPQNDAARLRRRSLGLTLARLALLGGDNTLARRLFLDLEAYGATPTEVEQLTADIARIKGAAARQRVERVQQILDEIGRDLRRKDRDPAAPRLEDYVFETLRAPDEAIVPTLAGALRTLAAWRKANPDARWSPGQRDTAVYCCRVLARLPFPDAVDALADWSATVEEHRLLVEVGRALCRTGRRSALPPLTTMRERLGRTHPSWEAIEPMLGRILAGGGN